MGTGKVGTVAELNIGAPQSALNLTMFPLSGNPACPLKYLIVDARKLFNDHNFAWSGATPYLGGVHALQDPWGKIGKTEFALAVACGYADMFGRGPWHNGEICRWSEARLRRVAGELSRAGVDPLELVHVVYMEEVEREIPDIAGHLAAAIDA